METLRQDLRYAVRTLNRTRRFAAPALGLLALGVALALPLLMLVHRGVTRPAWLPPTSDAPVWERGWSPAARTTAQMQAESLDALLWILGAATLLVLVVVCVNLGMLLLARGSARQQEVTLRAVLGAGRLRLTRQLLTEAGILCCLGATLGFILSGAAVAMLHASWPAALPHWLNAGPTLAASGLSIGLPVLSAVVCGLVPVRAAVRCDLARSLGTGSRSTPGPHEGIVRRWLVILAVAASVGLLVGAGLLLRSFTVVGGTYAHELGYDARDTLTVRLDFAGAPFADPATRGSTQVDLLERLGTLPGVRGASLASAGAWMGMGTEDQVRAQCGDCFRGGMWLPVTQGTARHHVVSPGYFEAMGIPLLRGREFGAVDGAGATAVAVISQTFANFLFAGRDPLGKLIQVGGREGEWYTVVGVAGEVRARGLGSGSERVPALYLSSLQHPPRSMHLAVRTDGDPAAYVPLVEAVLRADEAVLAAGEPMALEAVLALFSAPMRWFAGIFAALAAAAALIASVGLFGVVAFTVARRTREVGVRMALGARAAHVVRMIVGQSLRLTAVGAWLGLLCALSLARLLQVLFLGVDPFDPVVYLVVAGLLVLVAVLASWLPARRAARVDPMIALRYE